MNNQSEEIDYNAEPVYYCKQCLSLGIKEGEFGDYCIHCGSTDIGQVLLLQYHMMHIQKFGTGILFNKQ